MVFTALFAPACPTFTALRVRTVHPKEDPSITRGTTCKASSCQPPDPLLLLERGANAKRLCPAKTLHLRQQGRGGSDEYDNTTEGQGALQHKKAPVDSREQERKGTGGSRG